MNNRRFSSQAALTLLLLAILHPFSTAATADPLTLEQALELASETHPALAESLAKVALAQADAMAALADDDIDIGLKIIGRYIAPNRLAGDQSNNDSQASLFARKRLYDFGHTRSLENAATAAVQGSKHRYTFDLYQHKLEIMRFFFDVILVDLEYTRDNEAMAIAFVEADRARDQNELGQVSDVDLLAKEDAYQARRIKRLVSEGRLRSSRARLAQALNQPETLPVNLAMPSLKENDQTLPKYEELLAHALKHNSMRQALTEQLRAAQLGVAAQRAAYRPVLSGSVQTLTSQRDVGSRNPFQADLTLEVPIYQGERIQAKLSRARATVRLIQAELMHNEYELRQQILDIWQGIQTLRKQREQVSIFTDFQALEFDRAQARYELELATDFGDALVGQSEARLLNVRTEFELALQWANLAILTAQPYSPILPDDSPAHEPIE